jgi:hypothetical protein
MTTAILNADSIASSILDDTDDRDLVDFTNREPGATFPQGTIKNCPECGKLGAVRSMKSVKGTTVITHSGYMAAGRFVTSDKGFCLVTRTTAKLKAAKPVEVEEVEEVTVTFSTNGRRVMYTSQWQNEREIPRLILDARRAQEERRAAAQKAWATMRARKAEQQQAAA